MGTVRINMSIPATHRTGKERSLQDLTNADDRYTNMGLVNAEDRTFRRLEVEDLQAGYYHAEDGLPAGVPSKLRERIIVARNLAAYGWFCYEFHTISLFWSLSCMEMALWTKFMEQNPGPFTISHSGRGATEVVLSNEIEGRLRSGWRISEMPTFDFSFYSLMLWAADRQLFPEGVNPKGIKRLRDSMAHPKEFNWILPPDHALTVFGLLVEVIGRLWPDGNKRPRHRASTYRVAVRRISRAVNGIASSKGTLRERLKEASKDIRLTPTRDLPAGAKEECENIKRDQTLLLKNGSHATDDDLAGLIDRTVVLCFRLIREEHQHADL